jgi:enterobactin synthetase component D
VLVVRPDGGPVALLRFEPLPAPPIRWGAGTGKDAASCLARFAWSPLPSADTGAFPTQAPPHRVPDALARAVPRRCAAFAAGRLAAEAALLAAGCSPHDTHIGRLATGAPQWPAGFVGSIAHTDTHVLATVATAPPVRGVGVDLEAPLSDAVAAEVGPSVAPELRDPDAVARVWQGETPPAFPDALTLVFTAKEALYKALAPRVGRFFGFEAAECVAITGSGVSLRLTGALDGGFAAGDTFDVRIARDEAVGLVMAWLVDAPGDAPTSRPVR